MTLAQCDGRLRMLIDYWERGNVFMFNLDPDTLREYSQYISFFKRIIKDNELAIVMNRKELIAANEMWNLLK